MLKTLIKKQLLESGQFIYFDSKKGKRREKKSLILYAGCLILLFGYLMGVFYFMADFLAKQLLPLGIDWFYYLIIALIAIVYGVIGSAFTTYSSVYLAKDNDLLLSMPIRTRDLVISRLAGVYVMGLGYSCMILIPGIIAGQIRAGFNGGILVASTMMTLACSLLILALSALLGYIVARITIHTRSKAYITVLISLAAIGIYFYIYTRLLNSFDQLIEMAVGLSQKVENHLFLFYHLGKGFIGNIQSIGIISLVVIICTILSYYLIDRNFNTLVTTNKGEKKAVYQEEKKKQKSVQSALLLREFLHLSKSASYMLNCCLGTIMMLLAGVMLIIKADQFTLFTELFRTEFQVLIAICMIMMLSSMNLITAPSISIEGKSFYMLRSLPVDLWDVLMAKLKMHLLLTVLPTVFIVIVCSYVFDFSAAYTLAIGAVCILFVIFYALSGLLLGIRFANLNWTNETVAVKQNFAVLIEMFGGWAVIASLGMAAYFLYPSINFTVLMVMMIVLLFLLSLIVLYVLKNKGIAWLAKL